MNRLIEIHEITTNMEEILSQESTPNNREALIEKVDQLIGERGKLLEALTPPFTIDEKQIGKKLIPMNEYIQQQMNDLLGELRQEMKQVKKQKTSNRMYTNPYENVQTMDGMFLDSKK